MNNTYDILINNRLINIEFDLHISRHYPLKSFLYTNWSEPFEDKIYHDFFSP
jgi:hypothetical protein